MTDGNGIPLSVVVDGANRHDMKLTRATLTGLVIERPEPTTERPQGLCLDKGYDYDEVREILRHGAHPSARRRSQGSPREPQQEGATLGR